jgi:hypothetical protein
MAKRGDLKWGTVENLQMLIDQYFEQCKASGKVPTMQGMSIALDCAPSTIKYYANGEYEERLSKKALEAKEQLLLDAGSEQDYQSNIDENGIYCGDALTEYRDEIDTTKAQVSTVLKKAKVQAEEWLHQEGFKAKNPAYFMFYGKVAYKYNDQPGQEISLHQNNLQLNIKIEQSPSKSHIVTVTDD